MMRVLLTVLAWFAGIILAMMGIGFFLWSQYGQEYVHAFKAAVEEGGQLGAGGSDGVCFEATLGRVEACSSFKCNMLSRAFARACFDSVAEKTDLCETVPSAFDIGHFLIWSANTCEQHAPDNGDCDQVLREVVAYCSESSP
jgi:hypothetical protein